MTGISRLAPGETLLWFTRRPSMTFRNYAFMLATLFVYAPVAAFAEDNAAPILADEGQKLFQSYCVACHGIGGKGDGPNAAALTPQPADLTTIASRRSGKVSWGEIAKFIDGRTPTPAHGTREMPVWGKRFNSEVADDDVREEITRGDLAALVSYLKSIQRGQP